MYKDNLCLYQIRNDRYFNTGKMCSAEQEFVAISNIIGGGDFEANGVLGLAPVAGTMSFVNNLHE